MARSPEIIMASNSAVIWLLQNLVISVPFSSAEGDRILAQLPDKLIGLRSVVAPGDARRDGDRSMGNGNTGWGWWFGSGLG